MGKNFELATSRQNRLSGKFRSNREEAATVD